MLQPKLGQEVIRALFVDFLAHDEEFTRGSGVNGAYQIKHGGLSTAGWSSNHDEFTPTREE